MRHPAIYAFLKWLPPAIGGGTLGVAAIWSEAKDWISQQVLWAWHQLANPGIALLFFIGASAYIYAIIWTGQDRKTAPEKLPARVEFQPPPVPHRKRPTNPRTPAQEPGFFAKIRARIWARVRELLGEQIYQFIDRKILRKIMKAELHPDSLATEVGRAGPTVQPTSTDMPEPGTLYESGQRRRDSQGCPKAPIWQAIKHVRAVLHDQNEAGCFPETQRQIRQAALEGQIEIWGKRELGRPNPPGHCSEVWTRIDPAYWIDHRLNSMATGSSWEKHDHTWGEPYVVDSQDRYWELQVDFSKIEQTWPRE